MSSIFIRFKKEGVKILKRAIINSKKIFIEIIKSVLTYFWVNFWVQNDQKKRKNNLEEKQLNGTDGPLNFDPNFFLIIFFIKYKTYRLFWYQVYENRMKNKVSVI